MTTRIPPLLEPFLALPPEASLIVLTGVLGASTNWLIHRYLHTCLASPNRSGLAEDEDGLTAVTQNGTKVLFVSFLRDYAFWKDGAGRLGTDLDVAARRGRFVYIDGLTGLFSPVANRSLKTSSGPGRRVLSEASSHSLRKELIQALTELQSDGSDSDIVLILDSPDLLLAASGKELSGQGLQEVLLDAREVSLPFSTLRYFGSLQHRLINIHDRESALQ
jgi:elongator complex protein 6